MLSQILSSHSCWMPMVGKTASYWPYSCHFVFAHIGLCSKQFSKSSINPVVRKSMEEDKRRDDIVEDSETSKSRPRSSWVTITRHKKFSREHNKNIASNSSSSAHFKSDAKRRWKVGADITEQLDKIKEMTKKRSLDSFNTLADERHFRNSGGHWGTRMVEKHAKKIDHAEVERCVEILRNQRERLDMFNKSSENAHVNGDHSYGYDTALDWWNRYTQKKVADYSVQAPNNHYMEMLKWSEEGRLWSFPVNNEEGLAEEKDVPFYKHVFLDELIEDGFPKAGPVRKFMETVTVGLSTNPYLTLKEKEEHINWFRDYFNEKRETLETLGALGSEEDNAKLETDN